MIIAAPTNYDPKKNFFDCSAVESVIDLVPVGYTKSIREKMGSKNIIFSPEFLRESKALYDNLYPSRIIVSCDDDTREAAEKFAELLVEGAEKENVDVLYMGFTEAEAVNEFNNLIQFKDSDLEKMA